MARLGVTRAAAMLRLAGSPRQAAVYHVVRQGQGWTSIDALRPQLPSCAGRVQKAASAASVAGNQHCATTGGTSEMRWMGSRQGNKASKTRASL
jgi:hypothetical protein